MRRTHKLEQLLDTIVGGRDNIPLAELFAAAGVEEAKGRTTLQNAIEHGYFGADAYIDNRTGTLVVRGAAPQPPRPEPAPQPAPQQELPQEPQQVTLPGTPPAAPPAKEDLPVEPMPEERWLQVLERLNVINKMLAGALQGSGAYLRGQTVLIRCENPIFLEMMRSNEFTRQSLKRAIAEVTGMKYGVGPYTPAAPPAAPQSSPLEELARQAEGLGIPVTRE